MRRRGTHGAIYGSRKTLEECRPTAARVKFGTRLVKWCTTTSTVVNSFFKDLVVFSSAFLPVNLKNLSYIYLKKLDLINQRLETVSTKQLGMVPT